MNDTAPFAVIFDNDGVVVDSEPVNREAFRLAYAEAGLDVTDDDIERSVGRTYETSHRDLEQTHGRRIDAALVFRRKMELFKNLAEAQGIQTMPGLRRLLDNLDAAEVPFALASSGRLEKINTNMRLAGLEGRFRTIINGEEVKHGKPDPEIFLLAAERLGFAPERCVVIEDAIHGIAGARRAGMASVALTSAFPADRFSEADWVVESLEDLDVERLKQIVESRVEKCELMNDN